MSASGAHFAVTRVQCLSRTARIGSTSVGSHRQCCGGSLYVVRFVEYGHGDFPCEKRSCEQYERGY